MRDVTVCAYCCSICLLYLVGDVDGVECFVSVQSGPQVFQVLISINVCVFWTWLAFAVLMCSMLDFVHF